MRTKYIQSINKWKMQSTREFKPVTEHFCPEKSQANVVFILNNEEDLKANIH